MKDSKAYLFFWPGQFLYIGKAVDTIIHSHHAIQIAISFNQSFEIILPGNKSLHLEAAIINSDQPHECRTYDNQFLLLNIDPESTTGKSLKRLYLSTTGICQLPAHIVQLYIGELQALLSQKFEKEHFFNATKRFTNSILGISEDIPIDERIATVIELIKQNADEPIKIKDLSAKVFISPSRLIHLFTTQVGIPIRKYLLWVRLLLGTQKIFETKNIREAALFSGFSDAAHFNRTFKRMFGLTPSSLIKNSQIVQVFSE